MTTRQGNDNHIAKLGGAAIARSLVPSVARESSESVDLVQQRADW